MKTSRMMKLFAASMLSLTVLPVTQADAATKQTPAGEVDVKLVATDGEEKRYYFSGTARYHCDIWEEETSKWVSGYVTASSRSEALAMAREAGHAQAASWGRVISVHIETLR